MYQVNNPDPLEDLVKFLRNIKFDIDGAILTRQEKPIDTTLKEVGVHGTVEVKNTLAMEPVTVANMPTEMKIQENLHVVQTPVATKVAPFSFDGYGTVILSKPCRVYSIYLTVYEPTFIEIVGITGEIHTGEFKMDLFPLFIQVNKVEIKALEYVKGGGYILYENC
jgi:hypothetical protein